MEPKPEIRVFPERTSFYQGAAELVANTLASMLKQKQSATFVLNGGDTPKSLFQLLATAPVRDVVDWPRVHFFWSDERCVSPKDPQSNYGMAWKTLLSKINVPIEHIHRIRGELKVADDAAAEYEAEIRSLQASERVRFDLVLLGMGEEGHTASLFPGTNWNEDRLVIANYIPKLKAYRISMTPRLLNAAGTVVFLVAGIEKARAVVNVLEHPGSDLPAASIRPRNGRMVWLLDDEAASLLQRPKTRLRR